MAAVGSPVDTVKAASGAASPVCDIPLDEKLHDEIDSFISKLRHSQRHGSHATAESAAKLFRELIAKAKWRTARELISLIKREGRRIVMMVPTETIVGNVIRRILNIIREDYLNAVQPGTSGAPSDRGTSEDPEFKESLHKLFVAVSPLDDFGKPVKALKSDILNSVNEFIAELSSSAENITTQALEHIHSNEVILTIGKSRTVEAFLKTAAKKRKFHVLVVEAAPFFQGHLMAKNLAENNPPIPSTVITDSAIFAMMSRVNKVIIGTHTVMADGGLKALSGSHTIALAAKHYSVPLIVCASMFKLSPQYLCTYDQDAFNKFVTPEEVLSYSEGELISRVQLVNPVFDYVPPELVTLFISNLGGHAPSYVYRLLTELYHPDDEIL